MRKLLAFLLCLVQCVPLPLNGQRREQEPRRHDTPSDWEAGALRAAEELGCKRGIWQLRGETFEQVVTVYARNYVPGDCVILLPRHGRTIAEADSERGTRDAEIATSWRAPNYYLGYAGQFDGCLCAADPRDLTGTPVYTLSDDLHSVRL